MIKKVTFIFMFCVFSLLNYNVMAADHSNNKVVGPYKNWTIHFSDEILLHDLSSSDIYILDDKDSYVDIKILPGDDYKSLIISAPSQGYKPGNNYTLVISNAVHSKKGVSLKDSFKLTFSISSLDNKHDKIMYKLIVLPETAYDESEANKMIDRLSKINIEILESLANANVKIKLTNTNVTEVPEYTYLKGVTPRGWENTGKTWDDIPGLGGNPVIARIGYSEPSYHHGHGATNLELHETAHAIDSYVFDRISRNSEFTSIMQTESENLFPNDNYTGKYSEEYFAECFVMYYLNDKTNQKLKEKAPLTYKFFKELPNRICEQDAFDNAA